MLVFGEFAVVGIVANLAAVPVAGLVMLYGLPASLVAGTVPEVRGPLMVPVAVGTRCVGAVATAVAAIEQHRPERRRVDRRWGLWCACFARAPRIVPRTATMASVSVHLLTGDDESMLRAAVNTLVQSLVGDGDRSLMVDDFDAEDYTLGAVVDAAHTARSSRSAVSSAWMAGRFTADELGVLAGYLADPLPSTELVIEWGGQRRPKPSTRR